MRPTGFRVFESPQPLPALPALSASTTRALTAYLIGIRRLYDSLSKADCADPAILTNGHFHEVVEGLKRREYKNLYDAANCLQVIGTVIDKHRLTKLPIAFVCQVEPPAPRLRHDPKLEREAMPSKLPSKEAMVA